MEQAAVKGSCSKACQKDPAEAVNRFILQAKELFQTRNEVLIQHHKSIYRLRLTKSDKLILTK